MKEYQESCVMVWHKGRIIKALTMLKLNHNIWLNLCQNSL